MNENQNETFKSSAVRFLTDHTVRINHHELSNVITDLFSPKKTQYTGRETYADAIMSLAPIELLHVSVTAPEERNTTHGRVLAAWVEATLRDRHGTESTDEFPIWWLDTGARFVIAGRPSRWIANRSMPGANAKTWTQNLQCAVPGFELRTSAAGESLVLTGGVHERTLEVFCDEGEFTVAFAGWHTHTEDETHVIELAKLITDDDQVVMTAYRGAVSRCSQLCPPHEEEWVDFITTPFSFDVPDRFEVLSWSGKHDRSYPP